MTLIKDMDDIESEPDVWSDWLNIHCGGYNSEIDRQILAVAKLIVEDYEKQECISVDRIAREVGITEQHAELIQYILASICAVNKSVPFNGNPFTYGCSPRCLFVDNIKAAKQFLCEFERQFQEKWIDYDK